MEDCMILPITRRSVKFCIERHCFRFSLLTSPPHSSEISLSPENRFSFVPIRMTINSFFFLQAMFCNTFPIDTVPVSFHMFDVAILFVFQSHTRFHPVRTVLKHSFLTRDISFYIFSSFSSKLKGDRSKSKYRRRSSSAVQRQLFFFSFGWKHLFAFQT